MQSKDPLSEMSVLPSRFQNMLEHALRAVSKDDERDELCKMACVVSNATWRFWQAWRPPEDNRQEHEWIVFANIMSIAEGQLRRREKRIATAFAFVHDSFPIRRVMKAEIVSREKEAKKIEASDPKRAKQLRDEVKKLRSEDFQTRVLHMTGGAENAVFALGQLEDPCCPGEPLLKEREMSRLKSVIAKHDSWKIGKLYPKHRNKLALVCVEGDLLWPLHPIGILADIERPDRDGKPVNFNTPEDWKKKLDKSLESVWDYRKMWRKIPGEATIFRGKTMRTVTGQKILSSWRSFWGI